MNAYLRYGGITYYKELVFLLTVSIYLHLSRALSILLNNYVSSL